MTSHVAATRVVAAHLRARRTRFLLVGCQRYEFLDENHRHLDLSRVAEGLALDSDEVDGLLETGTRKLANVGTFGSVIDASDTCRISRGLRPIPNPSREKLLPFADDLRNHSIDLVWLADLVPGVRVGEGLLNRVSPIVDGQAITAAIERARERARHHRCSFTWVDDGPAKPNKGTLNTDRCLSVLRGQHPNGHRLLIKIVAHADHCPLDPPLIGPNTIDLAYDAHVCAIVIDAGRGIIWERKETLSRADQLGIGIIGA